MHLARADISDLVFWGKNGMESTDLADFTKVLEDIERRNSERLFYRLFPDEDTEQPDGSVMSRY